MEIRVGDEDGVLVGAMYIEPQGVGKCRGSGRVAGIGMDRKVRIAHTGEMAMAMEVESRREEEEEEDDDAKLMCRTRRTLVISQTARQQESGDRESCSFPSITKSTDNRQTMTLGRCDAAPVGRFGFLFCSHWRMQ